MTKNLNGKILRNLDQSNKNLDIKNWILKNLDTKNLINFKLFLQLYSVIAKHFFMDIMECAFLSAYVFKFIVFGMWVSKTNCTYMSDPPYGLLGTWRYPKLVFKYKYIFNAFGLCTWLKNISNFCTDFSFGYFHIYE